MKLISHDLQDGGKLPNRHVFNGMGYDGDNISPHLMWDDVPAGTKSFVVTCYDPDAPTGSGWWHWVVANLPADTRVLPQGAGSGQAELPEEAVQTRTDFGKAGYGGAAPPKGETHRYIFTVHARTSRKLRWMLRPAARWSALTSISIPSPAPPSPPCSVNLPRIAACALSGVPAAPFVFGWRCAYPTYTTPTPMLAQRRRAIAAGTEPLLCRAAADALPGLRSVPFVAPVSAAPPGKLALLFSDYLQRRFTHPRIPHHRQQPEPDQAGDQRHPRFGKHP